MGKIESRREARRARALDLEMLDRENGAARSDSDLSDVSTLAFLFGVRSSSSLPGSPSPIRWERGRWTREGTLRFQDNPFECLRSRP